MPRGTGPVIDQDSNAVFKKINRALERAGKIHSHSTYMVSSWIKIVMICKKWWQKPVDTLCVHSSIPPLNLSPTYHPFQPSPPPTLGKLWVRYSPVAGDACTQVPALKELTVFSQEKTLKSTYGSFSHKLRIVSLEDISLCYFSLGTNSTFAKGHSGK